MKPFRSISAVMMALAVAASACGPTPDELRKQEEARQDSLKKVQEQALAAAAEKPAAAEPAPAATPAAVPAPSATPVPAAAPAADPDRNYVQYDANGKLTLQVEAWRMQRSAEKAVDAWRKRGLTNAYVVSKENAETGEVWYRVRIGKFKSRKWANKQAELLKSQYNVPVWVDNAADEVRVY